MDVGVRCRAGSLRHHFLLDVACQWFAVLHGQQCLSRLPELHLHLPAAVGRGCFSNWRLELPLQRHHLRKYFDSLLLTANLVTIPESYMDISRSKNAPPREGALRFLQGWRCAPVRGRTANCCFAAYSFVAGLSKHGNN